MESTGAGGGDQQVLVSPATGGRCSTVDVAPNSMLDISSVVVDVAAAAAVVDSPTSRLSSNDWGEDLMRVTSTVVIRHRSITRCICN